MSSENANEWMITKGKQLCVYWPGPSSIIAREDPDWDGTVDTRYTQRTQYAPHIGSGSINSVMAVGYPVGNFNVQGAYFSLANSVSNLQALEASLVSGFTWMGPAGSYGSTNDSRVTTLMAGPGADTFVYLPGNGIATSQNYRELVTRSNVGSKVGLIIFNTDDSGYYFFPKSDLTLHGIAMYMGDTEPDFS